MSPISSTTTFAQSVLRPIAKTCPKHPCAFVLLLEIGVKTLCATVFLFEIGHFCWKASTCPKQATLLLLEIGVKALCANVVVLEIGDFCSKAKSCPKPLAQLFCCSKMAPKHSAQMSFRSRLATFVKKRKLVQNTVRNCRVAWNLGLNSLPN